jgi:hypothetical protein
VSRRASLPPPEECSQSWPQALSQQPVAKEASLQPVWLAQIRPAGLPVSMVRHRAPGSMAGQEQRSEAARYLAPPQPARGTLQSSRRGVYRDSRVQGLPRGPSLPQTRQRFWTGCPNRTRLRALQLRLSPRPGRFARLSAASGERAPRFSGSPNYRCRESRCSGFPTTLSVQGI